MIGDSMNDVEFNLNQKITLEEIYVFICEKMLPQIDENPLITVITIKDILEKIKNITNSKNIATKEEILEIIKELLPYKVMSYLGGEVIHRYKNPRKLCFFKYEIMDNEVYLYDNCLSYGKQKRIKVSKINGINISEIIKKLNIDTNEYNKEIEKILMHPELLEAIGIDLSNGYNLTLIVDKKERNFSLTEINEPLSFSIFEKERDVPQILKNTNFVNQDESETIEEYTQKLKYSFDSYRKLLQMMLGLSKNKHDIELFNNLLNNLPDYNIKKTSDEYLDWMFMSSFLLFNEQRLKDLTDDSYEEIIRNFKNSSQSYFLDTKNEKVSNIGTAMLRDIGYNKSILTSGEIDYKLLIKHIRDAFAHSSYEVIDENFIRCYGENFNVLVDKKIVTTIIYKLIYETNIDQIFTLVYLKENMIGEYNRLKDEKELKEFLTNISYISKNQIRIKTPKINNEILEKIENFQKNSFLNTLIGTKDIIKLAYNDRQISNVLEITFPADGSDNPLDIEYIISEIRKYGQDFYNHSLSEQYQIISKIIGTKELEEKGISTKIFEIINTKEKTTGNIVDTIRKKSPIEYIDYGKYLQATLITYLNSLLVYPCSDRYNQLNCENMNLDTKMKIVLMKYDNKDITIDKLKEGQEISLESAKKHLSNLEEEKKNFLKYINELEKKLCNEKFLKNAPKEIIEKTKLLLEEAREKNINHAYEIELNKKIEDAKKRLVIQKNQVENTENLNKTIRQKYHQIIIEHLRNALAHGRVKFPHGFDFNNIGNTMIKFEDYDDDNNKTFEATIILKDLLLAFNDENFLISIFPSELIENINTRRNG